jgi:hypothetical protein
MMMSAAVIRTQKPRKGDLVVGHDVYAFLPGDLPAVPGKIVATSDSGHSVTMEVGRVLAAFGLPRRSEWTWRENVGAYQQKGSRTSPGWGLALVRSKPKGR